MDIEVEVSVFFGFLYVYKWVGVRYDFHAEDVGKDFRFFYAGFGVPMCVGSQVTLLMRGFIFSRFQVFFHMNGVVPFSMMQRVAVAVMMGRWFFAVGVVIPP